MRRFYLQPLFSTSVDDNLVIILGGRQFTIYEDYYVEQNIDITETDPRNDILICSESEPQALRSWKGGPNLVFR